IEQLFERLHLVHELIIDVKAAGGVNDEYVAAGVHGLATGFLREALDSCSICLANLALVNLRLDGLGHDPQLLARGGTVNVNRDQQGAMASIFEPMRQLARGRRLTGTLQASHQYYRGRL